MTLQDVAERCSPPTTPQTIGRLETGARTVSVGWLNRIAAALDVDAADLVTLPTRADIPVAATLDHEGAHAPRREGVVLPPPAAPGLVAMVVQAGIGDYRSGDELWLQRIARMVAGASSRIPSARLVDFFCDHYPRRTSSSSGDSRNLDMRLG